MNLPEDYKYSHDHEWVRVKDGEVIVGITDYAQSELGEIVFVEVDSVGNKLTKGEIFGSVEAVKTVSELFLPVSGEIVEFNEALEDAPELINDDPFNEGWIVKVKVENLTEFNELLTVEEYKEIIG